MALISESIRVLFYSFVAVSGDILDLDERRLADEVAAWGLEIEIFVRVDSERAIDGILPIGDVKIFDWAKRNG